MSKIVSFRISPEQYSDLKKKAELNGMEKSEYIKARLFDDKVDIARLNKNHLSKYERDLINSSKKACNLAYRIALQLLSKQEADAIIKDCHDTLVKHGYADDEN